MTASAQENVKGSIMESVERIEKNVSVKDFEEVTKMAMRENKSLRVVEKFKDRDVLFYRVEKPNVCIEDGVLYCMDGDSLLPDGCVGMAYYINSILRFTEMRVGNKVYYEVVFKTGRMIVEVI